jgi:hypothetical protein
MIQKHASGSGRRKGRPPRHAALRRSPQHSSTSAYASISGVSVGRPRRRAARRARAARRREKTPAARAPHAHNSEPPLQHQPLHVRRMNN